MPRTTNHVCLQTLLQTTSDDTAYFKWLLCSLGRHHQTCSFDGFFTIHMQQHLQRVCEGSHYSGEMKQKTRHDLEEINYNKTLQFMLNQLLQLRCCSGHQDSNARSPPPNSLIPIIECT